MRLIEALDILHKKGTGGKPFEVVLACSCTPLHLLTFLKAHLQLALPDREIEVRTGLYGDLAGTLRQAQTEAGDGVAIALEWPDLDPRLGIRQLGGWAPELLPDIAAEADRRLALIGELAAGIAAKAPVVIGLPGLPLAPVAFQPSVQQSPLEAALAGSLARFVSEAGGVQGVTILNPREVDRVSPPADRHDVKAELSSGFPYQMTYASALGGLLARMLAPPFPKKGLITDLDDTLWHGILGDDGVAAVSWDQEHHAAQHGYYQQILQSLARTGVLVGVATKNSPELVGEALARPDLLVGGADFYPIEAGWGPKSEAVSRILQAWNIGAESVVFIDDSPMELEEVGRAHPGMECVLFPKRDAAAVYQLGYRLRDLFGKREVREEDRIRGQSLRASRQVHQAGGTADMETFLRDAGAQLSLIWLRPPFEPRILELINKTNQFNINGRRYGEAEWRDCSARPETEVLLAEYRDKYGPLGKIAVLVGTRRAAGFRIETWVMSCRAFSRRIEHHMLLETFDRLALNQTEVEYRPTERNGPSAEFFATLLDAPASGPFVLHREQFKARCPMLYHAREDRQQDTVTAVSNS